MTKLALFSPPLGVEGFAHEYHVKWTKSLWVHVQPLPVFRIQYIKKDRSHRSFLPWKSVVQTPETDTVNFFEDIYEQNRPLAAQNIECKELDDGWPESEKHVLQAALSMVVVKNSR